MGPPDARDWGDGYLNIYFTPHQSRTLLKLEERRPSQQSHPMVGAEILVTFAPSHRVPVAEGENVVTPPGVVHESAEKFGPLKVVLAAISSVCADREVRS